MKSYLAGFLFRWSLLSSVLLIASCAAAPDPDRSEVSFADEAFINRLTYEGHTLFLPESWSFADARSQSRELFAFVSPEGIEGSLEVIDFPYPVLNEELEAFFEDYILSDLKRVSRDEWEHPELGRILSYSGRDDSREYLCYFFRSASSYIYLHVSHDLSQPFSREEGAVFLDHYNREDTPTLVIREKPGFPIFARFRGQWYWKEDFKDGFIMEWRSPVGSKELLLGLWTLNPEEREMLNEVKENLVTEPFPYRWRLGNQSRSFTVFAYKDKLDIWKIYAVTEFGGRIFCMELAAEGKDLTLNGILERQEIQELLDRELIFREAAL